MLTINYSRGSNKFDNCPIQKTVDSFDSFQEAILSDLSKEKGKAYFCSPFKSDTHASKPEKYSGEKTWRQSRSTLPRAFLSFDFDGFDTPITFEKVMNYFNSYKGFGYTTASHTTESPRARVVVALQREVTRDEGIKLGEQIQLELLQRFGLDSINFDSSVYRGEQPTFTPVIGAIEFRFCGDIVNPDQVLLRLKPILDDLPTIKTFTRPQLINDGEGRESMLLRYAGNLRSKGLDQDQIELLLLEYNKVNINPPLDDEIVLDRARRYEKPHQDNNSNTLTEFSIDHDLSLDIDICGDVFNGKFFQRMFQGKMIYCYPRSKWLVFKDGYWQLCEKGEGLQAAKQVALEIAKYAGIRFSSDPNNPKIKKLLAHAQNTQNINRLIAMLQTAAAEKNMGIGSMNELDSDPMYLGCKNGVICLKTGKILEPHPDMLMTRQVHAKYDSGASCPIWLKFLDETFLGDQETIDYLQKALGYSLTGLVDEEVLHFCFGSGRNGKSVLANIITKLMGDYVITAPAEMLMRRDRNGVTNDIARLAGARLVLANETRSDQRFDDLTIKTLVSTERITARFLHNEYFQFFPTFKLWIRGNHKPVISDESNGAWRRMRLIPFENQIPEGVGDTHLESKLLAESEGILAWMVQGALKWQHDGLHPSARIKSASNQYRNDCDMIGEFFLEKCSLGQELKVSQSHLWIFWQEWCKENGIFSGSKKTFTRRLRDRGINSDGYIGGSRAYVGIELLKIRN